MDQMRKLGNLHICVPQLDCLSNFISGAGRIQQCLSTWSQDPVIMILLSPDPCILSTKAIDVTGPVCPLYVAFVWPVFVKRSIFHRNDNMRSISYHKVQNSDLSRIFSNPGIVAPYLKCQRCSRWLQRSSHIFCFL